MTGSWSPSAALGCGAARAIAAKVAQLPGGADRWLGSPRPLTAALSSCTTTIRTIQHAGLRGSASPMRATLTDRRPSCRKQCSTHRTPTATHRHQPSSPAATSSRRSKPPTPALSGGPVDRPPLPATYWQRSSRDLRDLRNAACRSTMTRQRPTVGRPMCRLFFNRSHEWTEIYSPYTDRLRRYRGL